MILNKGTTSKRRRIGAAYQRVSDQDSEGSLQNQEFMGHEEAIRLSHATDVEHVIEYILTEAEGTSGGSTRNRPKYQELWDLITTRRIDFLVAKEISRLNRSLGDFCKLMEHCKKNAVAVHIKGLDIDFNSLTGELLYKLLALLAEFERALIIERTKSGMRAERLQGKIVGGRLMLGFDHGKSPSGWVKNETELLQVNRLLDVVLEHDGFKNICKALDAEGIRTKYGDSFDSASLKRFVRSRRLEGIEEFQDGDETKEVELDFTDPAVSKEPIKGPVVDMEKLRRAREKIDKLDRGLSSQTRFRKRNNLLTGILFYEDGTPFSGSSGTSGNGGKHYYYVNNANNVSINADVLEEEVLKALSCYANDDEIRTFVSEATAQLTTRTDAIDSQVRSLRAQLTASKQQQKKIREGFLLRADARGTEEALEFLKEQVAGLGEEQRQLERSIENLEREKGAITQKLPTLRDMRTTLEYVFTHFRSVKPSEQRNFVREVFEKIVVLRKNQVKLFWRFAACDSSGKKFALGREWGPGEDPNRTDFPPIQVFKTIDFIHEPLYQSRDYLYEKYVVERLSIAEIAALIFSAESTVHKYLRKHKIPLREQGDNLLKKPHLAFGRRLVNRREISHHRELETIRQMQELRKQKLSYWKIADVLNTMRIPTKTRRGNWHARSVQQILDRVDRETAARTHTPS